MARFSDKKLAQIIYSGRPSKKLDAWATLYERYNARLIRYATRYLNGRWDVAEDAVQEAFTSFYDWASKNKPQCVIAKLYSLTRFQCLEILRKEKRYIPLNLEYVNFSSLDEILEEWEIKRLMRTFLFEGGLTEKEREVWKLRVLCNYSAEEVGMKHGITANNVGVTYYNAKKKWRQYLKTFRIGPEK